MIRVGEADGCDVSVVKFNALIKISELYIFSFIWKPDINCPLSAALGGDSVRMLHVMITYLVGKSTQQNASWETVGSIREHNLQCIIKISPETM